LYLDNLGGMPVPLAQNSAAKAGGRRSDKIKVALQEVSEGLKYKQVHKKIIK